MCGASAATPDDERIGTLNHMPQTPKTTDPEELKTLLSKTWAGLVSGPNNGTVHGQIMYDPTYPNPKNMVEYYNSIYVKMG